MGRKLRTSPAARIHYVARLRLVDGSPMAIEYLHIPADLVSDLTSEELEQGDLYEHLGERHGVRVSEAVQSIEPTVVTRAEADLLDVPEDSPRPCSSSASPPTPGAGPSSTCTPSTGATGTASSPGSPWARVTRRRPRARATIRASRRGTSPPQDPVTLSTRGVVQDGM
ncbi:GntR family transcriptional regulator OS=Streptomyces tendae OX=1932 GN=GUR47_05795 PE=4 SV=1 [Streptomyces tendae]